MSTGKFFILKFLKFYIKMTILHRNPANKLIKAKNTQLALIIVIADDKEDLSRKTQRCEAGIQRKRRY